MGHNDDSICKLANIGYDFIFVKFHDKKKPREMVKSRLAFTDLGKLPRIVNVANMSSFFFFFFFGGGGSG